MLLFSRQTPYVLFHGYNVIQVLQVAHLFALTAIFQFFALGQLLSTQDWIASFYSTREARQDKKQDS